MQKYIQECWIQIITHLLNSVIWEHAVYQKKISWDAELRVRKECFSTKFLNRLVWILRKPNARRCSLVILFLESLTTLYITYTSHFGEFAWVEWFYYSIIAARTHIFCSRVSSLTGFFISFFVSFNFFMIRYPYKHYNEVSFIRMIYEWILNISSLILLSD